MALADKGRHRSRHARPRPRCRCHCRCHGAGMKTTTLQQELEHQHACATLQPRWRHCLRCPLSQAYSTSGRSPPPSISCSRWSSVSLSGPRCNGYHSQGMQRVGLQHGTGADTYARWSTSLVCLCLAATTSIVATPPTHPSRNPPSNTTPTAYLPNGHTLVASPS